ncbi:hypothetical protein GCM10010282_50570 [Streptomyces roseolus]|nr:hypothetical protein GCM10010282_50570 [Streptomyces roseolus]
MAVPAPAHAARGVLTVNGTWYPDPERQCILKINGHPHYPYWDVSNHTDQAVRLYKNLSIHGGCWGDPVAMIPPGESMTGEEHRDTVSLWVPA